MSNTTQNATPRNNDFLIAEYTLGLLNLQETAQAHDLFNNDPTAVVTALEWENRFLSLVDQLTPINPPPNLLQRIQATLGHQLVLTKSADPAPIVAAAPLAPSNEAAALKAQEKARRAQAKAAEVQAKADAVQAKADAAQAKRDRFLEKKKSQAASEGSIWKDNRFWRVLSGVLAMGLVATLALNLSGMGAKSAPASTPAAAIAAPMTQVAILQAPGQTSTPGWVLTLDASGTAALRPKVEIEIPTTSSVYLWTHSDVQPQPKSLGAVNPYKPLTLPAELLGPVVPGQIFEMTLEADSESAPTSPKGAILFIGRTVALAPLEPVVPEPVPAQR